MKPERYDIVRRIAGRRAFSQWVLLPILMTLSVGTSLSQLTEGKAAFNEWRSVSLVAFLGSWAFALIVGVVVNQILRAPSVARFVAVIVVFFATEALRAVLVAWQAQVMGLDTDPHWAYRIVAGGLTGVTLFGLVAYLINETDDYRATLSELTQAKLLLSEMVASTATDIEVRRVKLLEQVRNAVTDSIRGVLSTGGASARDVADELVRVSEDVVRPLSHSLFPADEPRPELIVGPPERIRFRSVLHYSTFVRPFRPEAVTGFAFLLTFGAVVFEWPIESVVTFGLLLSWVFAYLWLARRFVTPRLVAMPLAWRVVTLFVTYIGFTIVPGFFALFTTGSLNVESWPYFLYIVFIGQFILWPLAIIAGVREARQAVIDDITHSNERLEWSRARLASYLWGEQGTLALALHKDVQGTLMAAAMKLKMSRDAGQNDAKAIDEIRTTVLEAAEFVITPSEAPAIETCVANLNERWQGVFRIEFGANTDAMMRLDADSTCRRIVADLLAEVVTNAVKHGQATMATVTLALVAPDVIRLVSENNGRSLAAHPGTGLGSRMLSAVSLDQGFENVPGGVRMWANIPIV